jgi:hypothetical protein
MKAFRPDGGLTVFVIFFGIAFLDSIRERNLLMTMFWICMGLVFIFVDSMKKQN